MFPAEPFLILVAAAATRANLALSTVRPCGELQLGADEPLEVSNCPVDPFGTNPVLLSVV